jgi:hypothetical protein
MPASSHLLDPIRVTFDDERAVADAGLLLTGTLIGRLGLEQLIAERVSRGYRPGRKFLTVASTLLAGGDCIDGVKLLHAGSAAKIVRHDTVAASTLGTWLRSLMFGHIHQFDSATETALTRAWQAVLAPAMRRCSSTSTRPSVRSTATRSKVPATATAASSTCIRCSRPGRTQARSCTPGCAKRPRRTLTVRGYVGDPSRSMFT